jgi:hypothetical protein
LAARWACLRSSAARFVHVGRRLLESTVPLFGRCDGCRGPYRGWGPRRLKDVRRQRCLVWMDGGKREVESPELRTFARVTSTERVRRSLRVCTVPVRSADLRSTHPAVLGGQERQCQSVSPRMVRTLLR